MPPGAAATATAARTPGEAEPAPFVWRPLLVVAVIVAGIYYLYARKFEETDDAQIDGNISNIGPRVTGTVTRSTWSRTSS